ncbi:hypothetical protein D3OALGA1CA_4581 [Olavius algarvensis associated proteobacterium Delta 3]|nr:hypothetical protein D3OALGB2SA_3064 [Olavius algarvensis associated proteobacterium Delta 3]CAB5153674.1 hypothetical protein D3OALGA1CA_4581 [Olavius algarvensis associated proteobacterium Delta 3]
MVRHFSVWKHRVPVAGTLAGGNTLSNADTADVSITETAYFLKPQKAYR